MSDNFFKFALVLLYLTIFSLGAGLGVGEAYAQSKRFSDLARHIQKEQSIPTSLERGDSFEQETIRIRRGAQSPDDYDTDYDDDISLSFPKEIEKLSATEEYYADRINSLHVLHYPQVPCRMTLSSAAATSWIFCFAASAIHMMFIQSHQTGF